MLFVFVVIKWFRMYHVLNVKSMVLESFKWFIFFVKIRVATVVPIGKVTAHISRGCEFKF